MFRLPFLRLSLNPYTKHRFFLEFSKDSFLLNLKDVSVFSELIGSECENNIFVKFFGKFLGFPAFSKDSRRSPRA